MPSFGLLGIMTLFSLASCSQSESAGGELTAAAVADVSLSDLYSSSYGLTAAERADAFNLLRSLPIRGRYDEVMGQVSDASFKVGDIRIIGLRSALLANEAKISDLDRQYASIGAYWDGQGFDPAAAVSLGDLQHAFQRVAPKAQDGPSPSPSPSLGLDSSQCYGHLGAVVGSAVGTCCGVSLTIAACGHLANTCRKAFSPPRDADLEEGLEERVPQDYVVVDQPGGEVAVATIPLLQPAPRSPSSRAWQATKKVAGATGILATSAAVTGLSIYGMVNSFVAPNACAPTSLTH